jgi:hypothetical protein
MNFKDALGVPRPHELSAQVQPMIPTPIHAALPSGHATEAYTVARVLVELATGALPAASAGAKTQLRELLMRQAARIAINRTVAGVHYPIDSAAGQLLGLSLGEYFIARCRPSGGGATLVDAWALDVAQYPPQGDFSGQELFDPQAGSRQTTGYAHRIAGAVPGGFATCAVQGTSRLHWLWQAAAAEW